MESLLENIGQIIPSNPWLAPLLVFFGGTLTASNPCVLVMIPLMIGFVGGYQEGGGIKRSFLLSLSFVFGLSSTFAILGVTAALLGKLFGETGYFWNYLVSAVCLIMGLHLLDIFQFSLPLPRSWRPNQGGAVGSFLLGLLFGIVSIPCATPILAVILTIVASQSDLIYGAVLLTFYALGHCVLILIAGTSMGLAKDLLESKGLTRINSYLKKGAGVLIIAVGGFFLIK